MTNESTIAAGASAELPPRPEEEAAAAAAEARSPEAWRPVALDPAASASEFDELQRRVALSRSQGSGSPFADIPDSLAGRLARLGVLGVVATGVFIMVGWFGYWYYQQRYPFRSAYYEADQEHMAQSRTEAERFLPPPDQRLIYSGATSLSRNYMPSSTTVTVEEVMVTRATLLTVIDTYKRRLQGLSGFRTQEGPNPEGTKLMAMNPRSKEMIEIEIGPSPDNPQEVMIHAKLLRRPTAGESRSLRAPGWMPAPPPGSQQMTVGGGGEGTVLGRVHQYLVPGPAQSSLSYYRKALERDGWERTGRRDAPGKTGIVEVYRRDSLGLTLQVAPLGNNSERSMVMLVPF